MLRRACIMSNRHCSDDGLALPGKSRCRAHGGGAWQRTNPSSKHRYGAAWQETRARVLRQEPNCQICGKPATEVDHVRAHADGGTDERSNLRALCHPCHKKHTSEQNRARRKR